MYVFLVHMMCLEKSHVSVLTDIAYVSPTLIVILLSCASRNTCSQTHLLHLSDA
jgi:hypothetical protein